MFRFDPTLILTLIHSDPQIATITTTGLVTESNEFPFAEPTGIIVGLRRDAWFPRLW